jgi:hypothetical protein
MVFAQIAWLQYMYTEKYITDNNKTMNFHFQLSCKLVVGVFVFTCQKVLQPINCEACNLSFITEQKQSLTDKFSLKIS